MREVTDQEILDQAKTIMKDVPQMKMCKTCFHCDKKTWQCQLLHIAAPSYMYGCKHHLTDEEYIVQQTRKRMEADAKREEKEDGEQNWRLTLALDCLNAGLRFLIDFESHVQDHYNRSMKRRDLDEAAVAKKEKQFIKDMAAKYKKIIESTTMAQKYYDHYILPHLNRVFKDADGNFDERAYTDHECDGVTFADLALEYADKTYKNESNRLKIIRFFDELEGAGILDEQGKKHYKFRR